MDVSDSFGIMDAGWLYREFVFQIGGLGVYFHLPIMGLIIFLGGFTFLVNPHLGRAKVLTVQALICWYRFYFRSFGPFYMDRNFCRYFWYSAWFCKSGVRVFRHTGDSGNSIYRRRKSNGDLFVFFGCGEYFNCHSCYQRRWCCYIFHGIAELIISFAQTTGTTMKKLEIHRITYGLGPFIVAYFVKGSRMKRIRWMLPAALFCYLTGFKRIGVAAVLASIVAAAAISAMRKYNAGRRFFLRMIGVIFILLALLYVAAVYFGLYDYLEQIGINTNLRSYIYSLFQRIIESLRSFLDKAQDGWTTYSAI